MARLPPNVTYGVEDHPASVAIADLDGDDAPDLAVANHNTDTVSVLLNYGNGTFADDTTYSVGDHPFSVAIDDLDGDGWPDLAVANYWSDNVSVLLNQGASGNQPPVANAGGPYSGSIDEEITFDASASYDPDGTVDGYRWDWTNDGIWDTDWLAEPVAGHVYDAEFHGQVALEVVDAEDATATDTAQVDIANAPPVADAGGPYSGLIGEEVTFDASASYDPDGTVDGYRWDWTNDGIWDTDWLTEALAVHVYDAEFQGQVALEVLDNEDATNTDTAPVDIIPNVLPVADAGGPYVGMVGRPILFDASGSDDPDGSIIGYRWDWTDDGEWDTDWLTGPLATFIYDAEFQGQVRLEVKDDEGENDSDTAGVTIGPASITYQYDALNRLVQVTYADGSAIVYEYDAVGNRTLRVVNSDVAAVCLNVRVDPPCNGSVIRVPDQIWYPFGTPVELTAVGNGACAFVEWTGDVRAGQEYENPLTIIAEAYKSITGALPVADGRCGLRLRPGLGRLRRFSTLLRRGAGFRGLCDVRL